MASFFKKIKIFIPIILIVLGACTKWKDKTAQDLGLKNKYCNNPAAINYNYGFPGITDSSVCIFPSSPFVGRYKFQDSIFGLSDQMVLGDMHTFEIVSVDTVRFKIVNYCSSAQDIFFKANRYYKADVDSGIALGAWLFCRELDTLRGQLEYNSWDSSLTINWTVNSDTNVTTHKGKAYKY